MAADNIVLVRHAKPIVVSRQPSDSWPIGSEGKEASKALALFLSVDVGTTIWSSTERKAEETATEIAKTFSLKVQSDVRLREVRRPWIENAQDYAEVATRFLAGERIADWEDRQAAQTRVSEAIEELGGSHDGEYLIAVTHGLVMTLYLESIGAIDARSRGPVDPIDFWSNLGFPDAWRIDLPRGWLDRIG
ncbi:MAG: histidine phosphatase family protein [Actinobacteria bacterium]|nr:histidine phosphatase family protein [Actinomycetota bacterium]